MKVAMLLTSFPDLPQTFVLGQITGMLDRGVDLDLFALRRGVDDPLHDEVRRYGLEDRARLISDIRPGVAGTHDIIHAQFGQLGVMAAELQAEGVLRGRLVTSLRGFDCNRLAEMGKRACGDLFARGDLFLPVSRALEKQLVSLGCPAAKIEVLRSGIDCRLFSPPAEVRRAGGPVRLITVGWLKKTKGVDLAVQAAARVAATGRAIEYVIVGDGPLRAALERLAEGSGKRASVHLLGWKTRAEVAEILKTADILLAPSVTTEHGGQEGIPNVLKEAMAAGLPVIGTAHAGIPELVDDGHTGF
ncbi:MAG TPA: glycosyltransferase, partial [Candidatus Methylomirabilis sp.]|nr:glycosyltransferase [Candidatus Methylomirabilis sp.]